jgi:Protein of unknown function (DUF2975)
MLNASRWIIRGLNWLNWGLGIPAMLFLLVVGFATPDIFARALVSANPSTDPHVMIAWIRWVAILLLPIIPLAHLIFDRLIAMIDSVPAGTALSLINVERLRQIAWALIGINIIDLAYGAVTTWAETQMSDAPGWTLSLTGWLAALMLFVLARVFRDGARMREELEGTI